MTTIEAAPVPTPPRVYLSHEGPAGRFVGSDMRCIECSFFHFSLRDPVWQQRQSRTENSNLDRDQAWCKIILPVLPVRCVQDEIQTVFSEQQSSEKGEGNTIISSGSLFYTEAVSDTDLPACSVT